jgi:hypothetical protein
MDVAVVNVGEFNIEPVPLGAGRVVTVKLWVGREVPKSPTV